MLSAKRLALSRFPTASIKTANMFQHLAEKKNRFLSNSFSHLCDYSNIILNPHITITSLWTWFVKYFLVCPLNCYCIDSKDTKKRSRKKGTKALTQCIFQNSTAIKAAINPDILYSILYSCNWLENYWILEFLRSQALRPNQTANCQMLVHI